MKNKIIFLVITMCDNLCDKFGASGMNTQILNHPWVSRGIFASHRDLNLNEPFYLYTGRGPSSTSMHLGHLIPMQMTVHLQAKYSAPVIIQITDDEKHLTRGVSVEEIRQYAMENIRDIIACGFDPNLTYIFLNGQEHKMYSYAYQIAKHINLSTSKAIFGTLNTHNIGQIFYPAMQIVPCMPSVFNMNTMKCLVPCAADQDPYFRLARDVLPKLGVAKPMVLHSNYLPSLRGTTEKMSSSVPESAIYLNDSPSVIAKKISGAYSGGGKTLEEHRLYGGDLHKDVCIAYLRHFELNEERFSQICEDYSTGKMTSGELKKITTQVITNVVENHAQKRASISTELLQKFMTPI